jgi:hypothetical protein
VGSLVAETADNAQFGFHLVAACFGGRAGISSIRCSFCFPLRRSAPPILSFATRLAELRSSWSFEDAALHERSGNEGNGMAKSALFNFDFFRQITLEYYGGLLTGLCVGITAGMAIFLVPSNGKPPNWFLAWFIFGCGPLAWFGLGLAAYGYQQRKKSN